MLCTVTLLNSKYVTSLLTHKSQITMTRQCIFLYLCFILDIPMLCYLQEMEQMGVYAWLLVILLICIDPLCGQYTVTSDPHTTIIVGLCRDPVISEPVNHIHCGKSI